MPHKKNDAAYLFFNLLANQEDVNKLVNDGAQENLSQELIAQQPIVIFDHCCPLKVVDAVKS